MIPVVKREGLFEDLTYFCQDMDELLDRLLSESARVHHLVAQESRAEIPPVEVWVDREGKDYHVRIALPGIDPQNVQLEVRGTTLLILAERKASCGSKDVNYLRREFSYGMLERKLTLPEELETGRITVAYNNGVLEVSAPLETRITSRRVELRTSANSIIPVIANLSE